VHCKVWYKDLFLVVAQECPAFHPGSTVSAADGLPVVEHPGHAGRSWKWIAPVGFYSSGVRSHLGGIGDRPYQY
jgi:hypothetical protein